MAALLSHAYADASRQERENFARRRSRVAGDEMAGSRRAAERDTPGGSQQNGKRRDPATYTRGRQAAGGGERRHSTAAVI